MVAARLTLTAVLALLVLAAPASAASKHCKRLQSGGAEVIRLERSLGCGVAIRRAVLAVIRDDGYYRRGNLYCRWGQGGTRPVRVKGKTYYGGFCMDRRTEEEVSFLGRKR